MLHKVKKIIHFKKKQKITLKFEVLNIFVRQSNDPIFLCFEINLIL